MHAAGRLFPRGDRAPAIEPVAPGAHRRAARGRAGAGRLALGRTERVAGGFYISQALELVRMSGDRRLDLTACAALNAQLGAQWGSSAPASCRSPTRPRPSCRCARLLRLSLFQVTVGMAVVLLIGTLNRVMIVELGVPAWLVAVMVSLPLVFAPFRAVVGFRSDTHRSVLGWRRVPYLWFGTLLQFGGLAIMPFALIMLSGDSNGPAWVGQAAAALAFLLVGAGLHTVQTVGLALATDLAPADKQPKVVALLCMMLLLGMVASALLFGALLAHFSEIRLIQVVQGVGGR